MSEKLKFDYLKNEKSFWSKIKNIFPYFTITVLDLQSKLAKTQRGQTLSMLI